MRKLNKSERALVKLIRRRGAAEWAKETKLGDFMVAYQEDRVSMQTKCIIVTLWLGAVVLEDGAAIGMAKRMKGDKRDAQIGRSVAFSRALRSPLISLLGE